MGFRGGNGPFGAHLPPRLRLGGKYGPLRPISHPQTMENREFTARIHCFTTITRTKYHCPPPCVTGPHGKECGVILMISNKLSSAAKPRPDLNGNDSVQTVWIELANHNIFIGGVYCRARPSSDLESAEFIQFSNQIIKAASTGKIVLVLGDVNVDHTNPNHKKGKEANDLLSDLEGANMRRLPSFTPTWKSYGRHKICQCPTPCGCSKDHLTSIIDNAYLSFSEVSDVKVLEDAISDHYPILVNLATKVVPKGKLKTIFRRDLSKITTADLEQALDSKDWSPMYSTNDPNEATEILLNNIQDVLDSIAQEKAIKIRPDKPMISLSRDTLAIMAQRDEARKKGNREKFKFLRNTANKLIKRDKIQGILKRLKKNPDHQSAWQEAKTVLGRGRSINLPKCTTTNPSEQENKYFIDKIARLVASLPQPSENGKMAFKCKIVT